MFPKSNYSSIQEHKPKIFKKEDNSGEIPTVRSSNRSKESKVKIHKIYGAAQGKSKNYMS